MKQPNIRYPKKKCKLITKEINSDFTRTLPTTWQEAPTEIIFFVLKKEVLQEKTKKNIIRDLMTTTGKECNKYLHNTLDFAVKIYYGSQNSGYFLGRGEYWIEGKQFTRYTDWKKAVKEYNFHKKFDKYLR